MSELSAKIEAILFESVKPITIIKLAKILGCTTEITAGEVAELTKIRNGLDSGIHLISGMEGVQLVSNPDFSEVISTIIKEEGNSDLTKPSLETLTIIAYRGPITKPEIEAIRGVNCGLIIRNLLMRGLIVESEDTIKLQTIYSLSNDALRFLGVHDVSELVDYQTFNNDGKIDALLAAGYSSSDL